MDELEAILETGGAAAVEIAASALAERGGVTANCPNCGHPLIGPYCAICGQPHNTHRRTLGRLLHEFVKDVVSFDSRILRTGRALLLEPGELPKAFREGRTQRYMPAVRLYLFVSLLFFLFLSVTGLAFVQFELKIRTEIYSHDAAGHVYKTMDGKAELVEGVKSDAAGNMSLADPDVAVAIPGEKADGHTTNNNVSTDPVFFQRIGHIRNVVPANIKKALDEFHKESSKAQADKNWFVKGVADALIRLETDPAALNGPLTTWIPRVLFVLLPAFALLLALFYRAKRKEYLFVDHLVFSLTMHSFAFVLLIGAAILAQVMSGGWVALLTWVALSLYFFLSLKHFYRQGWFKTAFKSAGISFVYATFFLLPALVFAIAASAVGS